MDAQQRHRNVKRQRTENDVRSAPYGSRQICLNLDRHLYDAIWEDAAEVRKLVQRQYEKHPELFPPEMEHGFRLSGHLPESVKMPGIRLRQIRIGGVAYTLRPSFVMPWCAGETAEVESPLLLCWYGVPCWLVTRIFGRDDMFWHRHLQRLGRNSLVGTTVFDPARLPKHLAADEHHAKWQGKKGYVTMIAARGCLLGTALTQGADQQHLEEAYGVFAQEARKLDADYAPETVNTDGWWATSNAFAALFPTIVTVLCFLHGFLKVRDRGRKEFDLHTRIWNIFRSEHIRMFDRRMKAFRKWFENQTWSAALADAVSKLWKRAKQYRLAHQHPDCYRTSNQVDRLMNRLTRFLYAGRGLHGHQRTSELRLRGFALLCNFRPFAPRAGQPREYASPAHRFNGLRYHENWLINLMISTSLAGQKTVHRKQ